MSIEVDASSAGAFFRISCLSLAFDSNEAKGGQELFNEFTPWRMSLQALECVKYDALVDRVVAHIDDVRSMLNDRDWTKPRLLSDALIEDEHFATDGPPQ